MSFDFQEELITPVGTLVGFTALTNPQAYENKGEPHYSCKLALDGKDPATIELVSKIEAAIEGSAEYMNMIAAKYGKTPVSAAQARKRAPLPFEEEYDEADNPTGRLIFKFRQAASIYSSNQKVPFTLPVVDSRNMPMSDDVYSGSSASLMFLIKPWYVASAGLGISLRPRGVQVTDLVTRKSDGDTPDISRFPVREGGYVAEAAAPITPHVPNPPVEMNGFDEL
jgi:hypothetical protein